MKDGCPRKFLLCWKRRYPSTTLSRTVQESILVAGSLGVRYLWVDYSCIMQDSPEDWQIESAMMNQVYANGLCNLCATSGTNGSEGLFVGRGPQAGRLARACINIDGDQKSYYLSNWDFGERGINKQR